MTPMNAIAAATHADPYPYYAALVAGPALRYDAQLDLWLAAGARAVEAVLADPHCAVRPAAQPVPPAIAGSAAGAIFGQLLRMNDGARHARPKLALRAALAGVDLVALRPAARGIAAALAAACDVRRGDALSAWLFEVPLYTVAGLLGFAPAQWPALGARMADFVACLSPLSDAPQLARASAAAPPLLAGVRALLQGAPARQGSLLRELLGEAAAAGWDDEEAILANLLGLLSQTYEATAGLIGNCVSELSLRPALAAALAGAPERIAVLVAEVSRYNAPVQNTRRYAARATRVCGVEIGAGQGVLLLLGAAGRDPAGNADPQRFLLERPARRVFGFGHGVHACPGHALACAIAAAAIEALLARPDWPPAAPLAWRYRASANARIPVFYQAAEMA